MEREIGNYKIMQGDLEYKYRRMGDEKKESRGRINVEWRDIGWEGNVTRKRIWEWNVRNGRHTDNFRSIELKQYFIS